MAKKYRSKKRTEQFYDRIFKGMLVLAGVVVIVALVAAFWPQNPTGYSITADGHVHDAAGNHVGDINDLLASGDLTVTEDGHIHDAAGNHIGDVVATEGGEADATGEGAEATEGGEEPAAE